MIAWVVSALTGDATLMALLTGGVHRVEVTRQGTPSAFDANLELKPCMVVRQESRSPVGPLDQGGQVFVVLWVYSRADDGVIDSAVRRAWVLLNGKKLGTGMWEMRHVNDLMEMEDQGLGARLGVSRYRAVVNRETVG